MALLMLNTLQTTRLLNVFHTENYTKTWNVKWCPLTSVRMEIQHHSRSKADDFTSASCETDSMAKADVWNQALNQHPLGAGPPPGVPAESTWLPGLPGERDTSLCPAWHWRPGHAREAAQRWSTQCSCLLWSALSRSCQEDRTDRKATDNLSNPDKQMESCKSKTRSHKEETLAKM